MLKRYAFHNKFSISDPKSYVKLVPDLLVPQVPVIWAQGGPGSTFSTFSSSERFFMGIRSSCSFCLEKAALLCHFQPPQGSGPRISILHITGFDFVHKRILQLADSGQTYERGINLNSILSLVKCDNLNFPGEGIGLILSVM